MYPSKMKEINSDQVQIDPLPPICKLCDNGSKDKKAYITPGNICLRGFSPAGENHCKHFFPDKTTPTP
jgi:hypothetical protein